jgi:ABC-2 type transport system ATP-binding protein
MTDVIAAEALSAGYGSVEALSDLDLRVQSGRILAVLGPNGAGKTTTIKVIMNLLRPRRGRVRVLGVESTRLGPHILRRIGYVSADQRLPNEMSVRQLERYCRALYPTWDEGFATELRLQLGLDPSARLKHLSRGMRVKAALLVSLAYRPELLILDEPFAGLDPGARADLVRGVLAIAEQERWTVVLTSHEMEDVQQLADDIAFLDRGRLRLVEPSVTLLGRFRRIEVRLPNADAFPAATPPSWQHIEVAGRAARFIDSAYEDATISRMRRLIPGAELHAAPMSLRDIFLATVASGAHPVVHAGGVA